jgi:hypothetical protein
MWVEKLSHSYARSVQLGASGIKIYKQVGKNIVKEPPKWMDTP